MYKVNLDDIRQALEAKCEDLLSGTSDREEILIERAADEFDRLQQQLNREVAIRNLDRSSKVLTAVEAALARFTDGTFGVCLHCEEPIPEKRLEAIPWAAYCISCQEKMDRQRLRGEAEEERDKIEIAA